MAACLFRRTQAIISYFSNASLAKEKLTTVPDDKNLEMLSFLPLSGSHGPLLFSSITVEQSKYYYPGVQVSPEVTRNLTLLGE